MANTLSWYKLSYTIVIADGDVPVLNGFEVIKHMKKEYPSIPVLMISGNVEPAYEEHALKLGAVGYITKPYKPDGLMKTIDDILPSN